MVYIALSTEVKRITLCVGGVKLSNLNNEGPNQWIRVFTLDHFMVVKDLPLPFCIRVAMFFADDV